MNNTALKNSLIHSFNSLILSLSIHATAQETSSITQQIRPDDRQRNEQNGSENHFQYTTALTPNWEIRSNNAQAIEKLRAIFEPTEENEKPEIINNHEIAASIVKTAKFSQLFTGTPYKFQCKTLTSEANLQKLAKGETDTVNLASSALGNGQIMRDTCMDGCDRIINKPPKDATTANMRAILPEKIHFFHSVYNAGEAPHLSRAPRMTQPDPIAFARLPKTFQHLLLDQKEPLRSWNKNKAIEVLQTLGDFNNSKDILEEYQNTADYLKTSLIIAKAKVLTAQTSTSEATNEEKSALLAELDQVKQDIKDHNKQIIHIAKDHFSLLVYSVENLQLTKDLHAALSFNPLTASALQGWISHEKLSILEDHGVPTSERNSYNAYLKGPKFAINHHKLIVNGTEADAWRIFGDDKDEVMRLYGHMINNPTHEDHYYIDKEKGIFKSAKEAWKSIVNKGHNNELVKLSEPDKTISEAYASGDLVFIPTDPNMIKIYAQVTQIAEEMEYAELCLNTPSHKLCTQENTAFLTPDDQKQLPQPVF